MKPSTWIDNDNLEQSHQIKTRINIAKRTCLGRTRSPCTRPRRRCRHTVEIASPQTNTSLSPAQTHNQPIVSSTTKTNTNTTEPRCRSCPFRRHDEPQRFPSPIVLSALPRQAHEPASEDIAQSETRPNENVSNKSNTIHKPDLVVTAHFVDVRVSPQHLSLQSSELQCDLVVDREVVQLHNTANSST